MLQSDADTHEEKLPYPCNDKLNRIIPDRDSICWVLSISNVLPKVFCPRNIVRFKITDIATLGPTRTGIDVWVRRMYASSNLNICSWCKPGLKLKVRLRIRRLNLCRTSILEIIVKIVSAL